MVTGRPAPPRILVVEDAAKVAQFVQRGLELHGYAVDVATTGRAALVDCNDDAPALVVLDVMLPDLDGFEVCRRIRSADQAWSRTPTPVLMLTGRDAVRDRIEGLEAGADDYLVKPFALEELIARVHALLRRARPKAGAQILAHADLRLDQRAKTAIRGERELRLTAREFDLLAFFLQDPNHVLTQDQILLRVWGEDFSGESNVLAVVIASLRRELEANGEPRVIHTVRGVGYVLRP